MARTAAPPLPRDWPRHVRFAVLHVISLAQVAITCARAKAATSRRSVDRLCAELERSRAEASLLREELRIKDARMARVDPRRRPHYRPTARMAILELKAARGWSIEETAKRFLVEPATIAEWMRREDEEGKSALVQTDEPVNRFPDFVRRMVRRLKVLCPTFGKKRIAQILSRAGIHLGVTTVGRMLKEREKPKPPVEDAVEPETRSKWKPVVANYPDHVWQIDLTVVPTMAGFWTAWLPFSLPQVWPFCWWVAFVVDHYSRRVMGFTVWTKEPTSRDVRTFLGHVVATNRATPKYVLSDKGRQFDCRAFRAWCDREGIQPRYASTGKQTRATAIVERFIRSAKDEWLRSTSVPFRRDDMRRHLTCYVSWFHEWRPHQGLCGRTPNEVYHRKKPANTRPRIELRPRWPRGSPCAEPQTRVARRKVSRLTLSVEFLDGHRKLPVLEVKAAA